jgi:hypothetical protein
MTWTKSLPEKKEEKREEGGKEINVTSVERMGLAGVLILILIIICFP